MCVLVQDYEKNMEKPGRLEESIRGYEKFDLIVIMRVFICGCVCVCVFRN